MHWATPQDQAVGYGHRWRAAHRGCGCGRPGCDGCPLTPRTVFVLQSELAWLVDLGEDDAAAVAAGRQRVGETVFASLPTEALHWVASEPAWLERFRLAAASYLERLEKAGPLDPRSVAEEVALEMAFAAARVEPDPDEALPPDVASALPELPGDYAWKRAKEAALMSSLRYRLDDPARKWPLGRSGRRHPQRWFEPF